MLHYCDRGVTAKLGMREFKALFLLIIAAATARAGPSPCTPDLDVKTIQTALAGVPAILRVPATVKKPPIVLWHGLGPPASESDLMKDLPLDNVPAVKVYLGLPLFGARAPAAGTQSLAQRQAQDYALQIFEPVVVGAARELPAVLDELRRLGCLRPHDRSSRRGFLG
jgi:hypothetical protein